MDATWVELVRDLAAAVPRLSSRTTLEDLEPLCAEAARTACALSGTSTAAARAGYAAACRGVIEAGPGIEWATLRDLNTLLLGASSAEGDDPERAHPSALLRGARVALVPPPHATARRGLEVACAQATEDLLHGARSPWLVAARLHLEVARAQVFQDGNGRLGLLAARLVLRHGLPAVMQVLPLESAQLERSADYWRELQRAMRSRRSIDAWTGFQLRRYVRACELALERTRQ